jgi:hypothetical protein
MNNQSADIPLLNRYFDKISPELWANYDARLAVYGGGPVDKYVVTNMPEPLYWFHADFQCTACAAKDEAPWVYDAVRNPAGVRCALQESQKQILGTRPASAWGPIERKLGRGFTNRPIDNVGVQYGLEALKRGQITPEQFVDLNLKIGGIDLDGNWSAERHEADREGLRNLYRSGQVTQGRGLENVPMVHMHSFNPVDNLHPLVATEVLRARLVKANGDADNLIHYVTVDDPDGWMGSTGKSDAMGRAAFLTVDKWMAGVEADRSDTPLAQKVRRAKPADAKDTCWANSQPGAKCPEQFVLARMVAGAPLTSDIQKCQLKPIDWNDYGSVRFTPDQQQRLQQAFPKGVCDWSKPGVEQQPPAGVWQTYADTVGGRPLGPAPRSQAVAQSKVW